MKVTKPLILKKTTKRARSIYERCLAILSLFKSGFYERMRRVHRLSDGYRNSEQDVGNTQSLTLTIQLCHLWTMTFPPLPFCPLNTGSDDSFEVDENSIIYIMIEKFE